MFHIHKGLAPLLAVLVALAMPAAAQVVYPDFTSVVGLTLNPSASQVSPVLRLTPSSTGQRGSAFLSSPIVLRQDASFCSQFAFQMTDPGPYYEPGVNDPGADGIVFAIQTNGNTALGGTGGLLGYFQPGTITTGVGVEFDTWNNGGTYGDSDSNHVAIDTNGTRPSLVETPSPLKLNDGTIYHAWVDYNGGTDTLDVYLSQTAVRPITPLLTHPIDLAPSLGGASVYPGFTSATGLASNKHDLLSWRLDDFCVQVDVKPGSYPNCFNINGSGVIPVAIFGSSTFDVTQVSPASLSFNGLAVRVKGNGAPQCSVQNVNGDAYPDLVCQFVDDPTTWAGGTATALLTGSLLNNGGTFAGSDEICIVP